MSENRKRRKPKRLVAWVALSDTGQIAYFIGCYLCRSSE